MKDYVFKKKEKNVYSVIKLFKIADYKFAQEFDSHEFIINTISFINNEFETIFNDFSLNYGLKDWKTFKGLKNGIEKYPNLEIVNSLCINDLNNIFIFTNFLLNLKTNIPEKGAIEINISVNYEKFDVNKIILYLKRYSLFDYGYITELTSDYDFSSETKIKKGFFGHSIINDKYGAIWSNHKYAMEKGFLRKIYPYNLLNQSHLKQEIMQKLMQNNVGTFQKINNIITMWILNEEEIKIARNSFKGTKYLLATKDAYDIFQDTQEALDYKNKTDLGLKWNSETCNYEYNK